MSLLTNRQCANCIHLECDHSGLGNMACWGYECGCAGFVPEALEDTAPERMLGWDVDDYYAALERLRAAWDACKPDGWANDDTFEVGDWTMLNALIDQADCCNVVIAPRGDVLKPGHVQLLRSDVEALLRIADILNNPHTPDLLRLIERLREDINGGAE